MENIPYEILIRAKNGQLKGIAVYDTPGGDARGITLDEFKELAPKINAASVAEIESVKSDAAKEAEKQRDDHQEQVEKIHASYAACVTDLRSEISEMVPPSASPDLAS
jgi:hypothetical protein